MQDETGKSVKNASGSRAPHAQIVRHRPQHASNAVADYVEKSMGALNALEAPKSASKRRRSRPKKQLVQSCERRLWAVGVVNMAEPEELNDDDEYTEVVAELTLDFARFGPLASFNIDRDSGILTVKYTEEAHAQAAVEARHEKRYGGRMLTATLVQHQEILVETTPVGPAVAVAPAVPPKSRRRRTKIKNAVVRARATFEQNANRNGSIHQMRRFVVKNLVEAAEVEDADEYEEAEADVAETLRRYGQIAELMLIRENDGATGEQDAGDVVVAYAHQAVARTAFDALNGSLYGGRTLVCAWVETPVQAGCSVWIDGMVDWEECEDSDEYADVCEEVRSFVGSVVGQHEGIVRCVVARATGQVAISLESEIQAGFAAQRLQQTMYGGRHLQVSVSNPPVEPHLGQETTLAAPSAAPPNLVISDQMATLLTSFLQRLASLQERAHAQNPLQDKRSRRLVLGLHEVRRGVQSRKLKLLLLATDFDQCDVLDSKLADILDLATREEIPVIQALSRRKLGRILKKHARVSCVGVYSYDGANDLFREILQELKRLERAEAKAPLSGSHSVDG